MSGNDRIEADVDPTALGQPIEAFSGFDGHKEKNASSDQTEPLGVQSGMNALFRKFAADCFNGAKIIGIYFGCAVLINIALKLYKDFKYYDPVIYYPVYVLELLTIICGFVLAVKIILVLAFGLWREISH